MGKDQITGLDVALSLAPFLVFYVVLYVRYVRRATVASCVWGASLVRAMYGIGGVVLVSYGIIGTVVGILPPMTALEVLLGIMFVVPCLCAAYVIVMLHIHIALSSALLRLDDASRLDVDLCRRVRRTTRWWTRVHGFLAARKGVDFYSLLDRLCAIGESGDLAGNNTQLPERIDQKEPNDATDGPETR